MALIGISPGDFSQWAGAGAGIALFILGVQFVRSMIRSQNTQIELGNKSLEVMVKPLQEQIGQMRVEHAQELTDMRVQYSKEIADLRTQHRECEAERRTTQVELRDTRKKLFMVVNVLRDNNMELPSGIDDRES